MPKKSRVDWKNMDKTIIDAIKQLKERGYDEPTVRSVYYVLGTLGVIPLTDSGYKSLDAKTVEMRKNGLIDWGFFAVKRGTSIEAGVPANLPGGFTSTVPYVTPYKWAEFWIEQCGRASVNFHLPRWYKQPTLVEVWVEKDGLLGATANWLSDLEVTVRSPQGYGAWEFVHSSLKHIIQEMKQQQKTRVQIYYLGDLDPSGKGIPKFMEEEALPHLNDHLGLSDFHFKEIALTVKQAKQIQFTDTSGVTRQLPQQPESEEVMEKIERDPRLAWYKANYSEDTFVELDALYALATDTAKSLIRHYVKSDFDQAIYDETRAEEKKMKSDVEHDIRQGINVRSAIYKRDRRK